MNALLILHIIARVALAIRAGLFARRPEARVGVGVALLAAVSAAAAGSRLFHQVRDIDAWGSESCLTHAALSDLVITLSIGFALYLLQTLVTELRATRSAAQQATDRARDDDQAATCRRMADGFFERVSSLLTTVRGATAQLQQTLRFDPEVRPQLRQLERAVGMGERLTHELQLLAGCDAFAPQRVEVNAVVDEVVAGIKASGRDDIKVLLQVDASAGAVVADQAQLARCLWRLVGNAIEAMPNGGVVELSTIAVNVRADDGMRLPPGRWVCTEVRDTGSGMSLETRRRALEPFFSTSGRSGLGLPAVSAFAEQCGGRFELRSRTGKGTVGRLFLPAAVLQTASERAATPAATPATQRATKPARVLVADDDEHVRAAARGLLEEIGCEVVTATDGQDALAVATRGGFRFDLVLSDVMMPRLGGPELFAALQERAPELPVVFMTGHQQTSFARGFLPDDCGVISKPFGVTELRLALQMALHKRARSRRITTRDGEPSLLDEAPSSPDGRSLVGERGDARRVAAPGVAAPAPTASSSALTPLPSGLLSSPVRTAYPETVRSTGGLTRPRSAPPSSGAPAAAAAPRRPLAVVGDRRRSEFSVLDRDTARDVGRTVFAQAVGAVALHAG